MMPQYESVSYRGTDARFLLYHFCNICNGNFVVTTKVCMRIFFTFITLLICIHASSQKIYGTVFTEMGDLLPFASVTVKGSSQGASANDKARFSFNLPRGNYTIICQHIGYTTAEKKISVDADTEISFILKEQKLVMNEVIVKSGGEDPAYEIIRQAIKKRNVYAKQVNAFEVDLYAKDLVKLRSLPTRIFGQKIPTEDRQEMGLDSTGKGIIYLSESISKIYAQEPGKFKMEVSSSRVSGSGGFGFSFPAFISLYSNNVKVFTDRINPRGFVSPIADGAIGFYKFKFLGTFWEDGKAINSIRVTPRRTYEPLFTGIINITDDDWRIHSFDLQLTKTAQLELLDTLRITQQHVPVTKEVWRVKNQLLYFNFKQFGIDAVGNFLNVYSNYNITPSFKNKFFDNIIIKYDTAVNKRSKAFWDTARAVPLEREEQLDYKVKDSIYELNKDSALTRRVRDSLNSRQGRLKLYRVFWNGLSRTRYTAKNKISWGVEPLIPAMEYNTAEGVTVKLNAYLNTFIPKWKTGVYFQPHLRYGFSNTHLNAWAGIQFRTRDEDANNKVRRFSWEFAGGKRVSEFNKESQMLPIVNSIATLLYGNNYMKTYENYFGSITYKKRYESGVQFSVNALFEDRLPLNNSTHFTIYQKDSSRLTPNYPYEKISSQFTPHQAAVVTASISFRPGQRYIQLPYRKISAGSKYPTFAFTYSKGISGILGSDVDFDKWKLSVTGEKNFRLAGLTKFQLGTGGFLNSKKVYIQDYQHFNGNRSVAASEYVNSFQLASFYAASTTAAVFYYGHAEHHFNGLLTNKIPLFKRLNWTLVAGSNAFYVNKSSNYAEVFAGIENILKIFRVDFVAAYQNGNKGTTGIRIGAGGILGGSVKLNRGENSASVSL
jgi:Family of unknown function (DUF5686)/CarboxypepD_reg-like domain